MRTKATPEDFSVEEQIRLPPAESGQHGIFRIRKRDVTTLHVQAGMFGALIVEEPEPVIAPKETFEDDEDAATA